MESCYRAQQHCDRVYQTAAGSPAQSQDIPTDWDRDRAGWNLCHLPCFFHTIHKTNHESVFWVCCPAPQMQEVLADWRAEGEESARANARLWTWHFATSQGRAYLRSGCCSSLAQLAELIAVDPQVFHNERGCGMWFGGYLVLTRDTLVFVAQVCAEVRLALLIANRQRVDGGDTQVPQLLGDLPRELLHAILFDIGRQRQPAAGGRWELINEGDDGLPDDWRARTINASIPPAT
jgi:hypothetical protein